MGVDSHAGVFRGLVSRGGIACEAHTYFRSSLFRRERSDDRKYVCASQAGGGIIYGPFLGSFAVSGSFAVGDHLRYCTAPASIQIKDIFLCWIIHLSQV